METIDIIRVAVTAVLCIGLGLLPQVAARKYDKSKSFMSPMFVASLMAAVFIVTMVFIAVREAFAGRWGNTIVGAIFAGVAIAIPFVVPKYLDGEEDKEGDK